MEDLVVPRPKRLVQRAMTIAVVVMVVGSVKAAEAQPVAGTTKVNPNDGLTYVWIPPATFRMGCLGPATALPNGVEIEACLSNELPRHSVTLTKGFWLGQVLVTQAAYRRVMNAARGNLRDDQLPVDAISWDAAQIFCARVGMRLPTEAEWEWAARGGVAAERYGPLNQIAWHRGNSGGKVHAVGQKQPSAYGLHDMLGNVWEWVADWYADYRQVRPCCDDPADAVVDPKGPETGRNHVLRGGSWRDFSADVRMSLRDRLTSAPGDESLRDYDSYATGFRCAGD
jgi:formylglycine-generating enzyme required for sulfatase activity